jgi:hypothetical protein
MQANNYAEVERLRAELEGVQTLLWNASAQLRAHESQVEAYRALVAEHQATTDKLCDSIDALLGAEGGGR